MKSIITLFFLVAGFVSLTAQYQPALPEFKLEKSDLEAQLYYLASDELAGRRTASPGGKLAAEYIAKAFQEYGVKPAPGAEGFFQNIPFNQVYPAESGNLQIGGSDYKLGDNLLILNGKEANLKTQAVFAGHGWVDKATGRNDYKDLDVRGKIVFVLPGTSESTSPGEVFEAMSKKREFATEHGAAGLVELFRLNFPWRFFKNYFGAERMEIGQGEGGADLLYGWLKEATPNPIADLEKGVEMPVTLVTSGVRNKRMEAANIVGIIEGTDEKLKDEYILLSAHYDHVGVGKEGGSPYTKEDSIFNGARDNGMGTVALLAAAKALAASPPKRSILLLACTGEEMGMLGSAYYADHPLVPLEKMVYNFNNDGAGYNSTSIVSVIGLERTNVDKELVEGGEAFGLKVTGDPAPEQGLYDRSDNISFARKGIPAINYAPGITGMDEAVFKYYHQAVDNPESVDYDYLLKFCQAFAHSARLIADKATKPAWTPGDKYERN